MKKYLGQLNLPEQYPKMKVATAENGGVREQFIKARAEIPDEVATLAPYDPENFPRSMKKTYYVAPNGSDRGAGTLLHPFATVERALEELAGMCGGMICLRGGEYRTVDSITVNGMHGGTTESPLIITAYGEETPVLTNSSNIPADAFTHVTDAEVLARLQPEVRDHVLVADLAKLGMTDKDWGKITRSGCPILFVDGKEQTIARYPNADEPLLVMGDTVYEVGKVDTSDSELYAEHKDKTCGWKISLPNDRPLGWKKQNDIWIFGAVYAEWNRMHYLLSDISADDHSMSSDMNCPWGAKFRKDNHLYFYNVLEELDVPGEWYLDTACGKLYYYPIADLAGKTVTLLADFEPVIRLDHADNVILDRLTIKTAGSGIVADHSKHIMIQRLHEENIATCGVTLTECMNSGLLYCDIGGISGKMVHITGTSRRDLIPDHNFMQNCHLYNDDSRHGGLTIGGMGTVISHNLFTRTVIFVSASNECVLEYNDFDRGSPIVKDNGPIYINGHDIASRGNHIRYNRLHGMDMSRYGIYLDDCASGNYVYGNLVAYPQIIKGTRCVNIHGGRENVVYNNIAVNAQYFGVGDPDTYYGKIPPVPGSFDRWRSATINQIATGYKSLSAEAFARRYPIYTAYMKRLLKLRRRYFSPRYHRGDEENYLRAPSFTVYENNIIVGCEYADLLASEAGRPTDYIVNNYESKTDPGFTSPTTLDYSLPDDSPVFKTVPGFEKLPMNRVGIIPMAELR